MGAGVDGRGRGLGHPMQPGGEHPVGIGATRAAHPRVARVGRTEVRHAEPIAPSNGEHWETYSPPHAFRTNDPRSAANASDRLR